ncbi:hypothetical protein JCM8202_004843 [Rhodotorula sphaerocarpa]
MPDNKPITRPRPRSTPTCARWLSKTTIALAIAATLVGAQLQPGPYDSAALTRDPDLNDVLESAVWPAGPGAPPPDGYNLLLERARRQVRFEERAEQEAREKRQRDQQLQRLQQRPDLASPGDDAELGIQDPGRSSRSGSVRVVRETFYVPLDGSLGGGEADPNVARVDEGAAKGNASEVLPETPADFRQTVGRLRIFRPLFTWAIHHPLRFLFSYILAPILSLVWTLILGLLNLVLFLLSPLTYLISTLVLSPLRTILRICTAFAPLLWALLGALAAGAGLGALGGLVAGRSTRSTIDGTIHTASRSLRWLGVLPKLPREEGGPLGPADDSLESEGTGSTYGEATAETTLTDSASPSATEEEGDSELVTLEETERQKAAAAAVRRANRILALRHRVKLEGSSGPS